MNLEPEPRQVENSTGVVSHQQAEEDDTATSNESADDTRQMSSAEPEVAHQLKLAQDITNRYRRTLHELAK